MASPRKYHEITGKEKGIRRKFYREKGEKKRNGGYSYDTVTTGSFAHRGMNYSLERGREASEKTVNAR